MQATSPRVVRLAYLVSHPIQYQAPPAATDRTGAGYRPDRLLRARLLRTWDCVFPTGNIDALTDALRRVLGIEGTAEVMGQNALTRIATWSFEEDVQGLRKAIAGATGKFVA